MGEPYTLATGMINASDFIKKVADMVKSNRLDFIEETNRGKKTGVSYLNAPCGFDIETSSFYQDGDDSNRLNKRAIMYHWQFGIWNMVTSGRTWESFKQFIYELSNALDLSNERRIIVYIHYMAYEWGFMRKHFQWDKVFLLDNREPAYALMENTGIMFKDSLILWGGKSLAAVGNDLQRYKVKKMKGDLDYSKIRTSLTPLTEKELKYCENDIRVILAGIQEEIEDNGNILKIPMTNTQRVRIYARLKCYAKYKHYRNLISKLTITADEYLQLKRAFQGGFVHANSHYVANEDDYPDLEDYVGPILTDVSSFDFTSKYPSVMCLRQFPMSKGVLLNKDINLKQLESLCKTNCVLFDLTLRGYKGSKLGYVEPRFLYESMWSESKCHKGSLVDAITNNGRVYRCKEMTITCTELDFACLKEFYKWKEMDIKNVRVYDKGYLPKDFVLAILDLYEKKTQLKGIHSELARYMISKNMLNALYGMIVTDIFREEWAYTLEHNYLKMKDKKDIGKYIQDAVTKYNTNGNRFLYYPWGVWVTAWARHDLLKGIIQIGEDYIYSDTDSIKFKNKEAHDKYFKWYNDMIMSEIEKVSKLRGIPVEKFIPLKGEKEYPIGVWDDEGTYDLFKTQGAKRYMYCKFNRAHKWIKHKTYRVKSLSNQIDWMSAKTKVEDLNPRIFEAWKKHPRIWNKWMKKLYGIPWDVCLDNYGNEYVLTLAGASKISSMEYIIDEYKTPDEIFSHFTYGLTIPANKSGRTTHTYIECPTKGMVVDYMGVPYEYEELSSIHIENTSYTLRISDDYEVFLRKFVNGELVEDGQTQT